MGRTALVAIVLALALGGVASGGSTAAKQRVAIDGKFNVSTESGTFKIIALTPGGLKANSGKFTGTGNIGQPFVAKNGQEVTVLNGTDSYKSAKGTLNVAQQIQSVKAGRDYVINTGTWLVVGGTGVYAGYKGGGTFAAVLLPSGISLLFREEGYLTKS